MNARAKLALSLLLLCCLYSFHVRLKTEKIFSNPTWDWRDETGQFWSEFAIHYRFAKFFSEHPVREWDKLRVDRSIQYPDTVNDWAEFTVAMEIPVGVLYRWIQPQVPFHVWVVWYDCLVSSLTLFGLFFLACTLWKSHLAGLLSAALYAGLYPSYGRTVKNLFLREDFAIPLIVFAILFTIRAWQSAEMDRRSDRGKATCRVGPQILAALFWLAALASWHLTQFVFAVGVGAATLVYLGKGQTPRCKWFVWLMLLGGITIPVLQAKQFYVSPTMCALYALALAVWINGGRKRAVITFVVGFTLLMGVGALLRKSYSEYAHVYQLFFYKLRYLGVRPDDPARLPWEARCLWEGAFGTTIWREFWRSLHWCLPLALLTMVRTARGRDVSVRTLSVFTLFLFLMAWMVTRSFVFLGFAVAVMAPGRVRWLAVIAASWQLILLDSRPMERLHPLAPAPADYRAVVEWIRGNTPTNTVVLSSISESPVFLAHTERAIILHSKFENRRIRERYREFLSAAYGSEKEFHEFCLKYGADVFVWDIGFLSSERQYKAGKTGEIDPDSAVALFANHPERLQRFKPELSTGRLSIFRVGTHPVPAPDS